MAVTNNGLNLIGDALAQATTIGATIPANATFTDILYRRSATILILKSVYENATEATGFDAMVADANAGRRVRRALEEDRRINGRAA